MKFIKVKILAFLIAVTAVSFCSCSGSESSSDDSSSKVTEPVQTEISSETEAVSESVTEPAEEPAVTAPEIKFKDVDFDSFPSGKYVKPFREGNYNIKYHLDGKEDSTQTLFFKDNKLHIFMDSDGVQYEMIYMDRMMYNIYKDSCYAEPNPVDVSMINVFGYLDYETSGTDDFNGTECRYDEFTDLSGNLKCRIYLDDEGNMVAFEESDTVMIIDSFSDDFSSEGLFTVSDDLKQLSYNEFSKLMMEAFSEALKEKNESVTTVPADENEAVTTVQTENEITEASTSVQE